MSSQTRIKVYGTEHCSFCLAVRMLLKKKGISYRDISVGDDAELRRRIEQLSGRQTVPQVFLDDKSIGGFDELYALEQSGELDRMLLEHQPQA